MEKRLKLLFRTIISVNQLSLHGAVAEMCQECDSCHDRTGRPVVGRTIQPIVRAKCDEDTHTFDRWPCTRRRSIAKVPRTIEKLSQQDRVSKFCTDAGFLTTVEVGQYFMTKDTEEFSQFTVQWPVVSTLCHEM